VIFIYNGIVVSNKEELLSFAGEWTGEHHLSEVSEVHIVKAACSLSYAEYRPNTNTSNIYIYTCKYIQNMYTKVGLVEETKGGGKGKKDSE
jgi:hypothetical protein